MAARMKRRPRQQLPVMDIMALRLLDMRERVVELEGRLKHATPQTRAYKNLEEAIAVLLAAILRLEGKRSEHASFERSEVKHAGK